MDQPDTHSAPDRPWVLMGAIIAGFLGFAVLAVLLPHNPYVRYQQLDGTLHFRSVWAYERVAFDDTPIEIAIIGNSRLQSAVSAPVMQEQLRARLGRSVRVANLSLPQEGRNAHYAMAKQLFEHHPEVKLLVVSAIEAMPRDGHPAFRNIASASDIVTAPALINRGFGEDLAFLPFRQMSLFLQTQFPGVFGVRTFTSSDYWGADYDTTLSYVSPTGGPIDKDTIYPADTLRPFAQERAQSITPPVLPEALASREFAIEHHYTDAIADLAREHGAELAFLYTPIFDHPLPLREENFYRERGRIFTVDCVAGEADKFSDYGHLNTPGAHAVSRMFADTLARNGWGETARGGESVISLCR